MTNKRKTRNYSLLFVIHKFRIIELLIYIIFSTIVFCIYCLIISIIITNVKGNDLSFPLNLHSLNTSITCCAKNIRYYQDINVNVEKNLISEEFKKNVDPMHLIEVTCRLSPPAVYVIILLNEEMNEGRKDRSSRKKTHLIIELDLFTERYYAIATHLKGFEPATIQKWVEMNYQLS